MDTLIIMHAPHHRGAMNVMLMKKNSTMFEAFRRVLQLVQLLLQWLHMHHAGCGG